MSQQIPASDLEKQYSPSMWSQRFSREEVLRNFVEVVKKGSKRSLQELKYVLDVEYGPTPRQKFDIFGMDLPDDVPLLVYIHGGYWQEMSRELSRYPAPALRDAGIRTVVVGYDLCPAVTLPEIVQQICEAVKMILQFAECTKSRGVYLAGHSAGAHLVAKVLSNVTLMRKSSGSERLQAAFLISGVFDLRDLIQTTVNDVLQLDKDTAVAMSPIFDDFTHLKETGIRIYVLAGQHDSSAFKKQSKDMYQKLLIACSVENMYLEIKDDFDHFEIVESLEGECNFLKNLLIHDICKWLKH